MSERTLNPDSILDSVKLNVGRYAFDDDNFDADLIMHINTTLMILRQLGVGKKGFSISGSSETWDEFLEDNADPEELEAANQRIRDSGADILIVFLGCPKQEKFHRRKEKDF